MARTLINLPQNIRRGDVIEVRATIGHPMETGLRPDAEGKPVPRDIITRFSARYNGEPVFEAQYFIATSANPYIAFHLVAQDSGTLRLSWEGDNGFTHTETVAIAVA